MKTKQVMLIGTIGMLLIAFQLNAQPREKRMGPPPPPDSIHVQKMMDDMGKALALTQEQKTEISQIFLDEMKTQKKKQINMEAERILEREQTRKELDQKVKNLLSEDQATAYIVFEERHRPENRPRPPKPCPEEKQDPIKMQ